MERDKLAGHRIAFWCFPAYSNYCAYLKILSYMTVIASEVMPKFLSV